MMIPAASGDRQVECDLAGFDEPEAAGRAALLKQPVMGGSGDISGDLVQPGHIIPGMPRTNGWTRSGAAPVALIGPPLDCSR